MFSSGRYRPEDICGKNYRFTWTPFGEGNNTNYKFITKRF